MFNSDVPSRAELPSSQQLLRSTFIALGVAAVLLVTVVLPSEYAIDPTGFGRVTGLTEMGEIKEQLATEAEQDRLNSTQVPAPGDQSSLSGSFFSGLFIRSASAQEAVPKADDVTFSLKPNEGREIKLVMVAGAKANFAWTATGKVCQPAAKIDPGSASKIDPLGADVCIRPAA